MTSDFVSAVYRAVPPLVSRGASSLFRTESGAKSLFLMSGCGVKCYVPVPAGDISRLTTLNWI